jgi:phage terminase large subunit-like protein
MPVKYPLANKANRYARDVVSGKKPACKLIIKACKNHLDDLKKQTDPGFPYKFDKKKAEDICDFAELMPHVKGKWVGTAIILEPWQCFFFAIPFGWVRKKDKLRRYREIYAEIPRKNAKSTMGAIIGLYLAFVDGEPGAEVYSGAATEKQAFEVFRPAWLMAKKVPEFRKAFGIELAGTTNYPGNIFSIETGSRFEVVVGKPGDGASVHGGIIDEFHEHKTDHTYNCFNTGQGSREQPMLIVITTSGTSTASPCYATRKDAIKTLNREIKKDTLFVLIYTLDPPEKPKDNEEKLPEPWTFFENWRVANPNYGVSVFGDYLKGQYTDAINITRQQNILKCKHLNIWSNAAQAYFNMVDFDMCADVMLSLEDFDEEPCFVGLDLAAKIDLAALMILFKKGLDYYLFSRYYLPSEQAKGEDRAHYAGWAHDGYINLHEGNRIDLNIIQDDIKELAKKFDLQGEGSGGGEVCNDPWNAQQLVKNLDDEGIEVTEITQTVNILSEPMKETSALILDGRLHHDGNPVTRWCFENTMATEDKKGNVFPFKEGDENKIDGCVATLNAITRAMVSEIYSDLGNDGSLI